MHFICCVFSCIFLCVLFFLHKDALLPIFLHDATSSYMFLSQSFYFYAHLSIKIYSCIMYCIFWNTKNTVSKSLYRSIQLSMPSMFLITDLLSDTNGLKKPSAEKRHNCDECDFTTVRPSRLKLHKAFKHSNGRLTSFLFYYYYFLNYKFSLLFYIGFKWNLICILSSSYWKWKFPLTRSVLSELFLC